MVVMRSQIEGRRAAGAGSRMEELYRAHAPQALRLAYLLCGDRALAEDLVQDAFIKVFGRFADLRNPDAFWWYLRRTLVNLSRSHLRRVKVEREYLSRERRARQSEARGPSVEERDRVLSALRALRPEQRAAIVLRYYEDLTEADAADAMGVAVGTVKSLVHRGMARLRDELGEG